MCQGGAETEPAFGEGVWVNVVNEALAVDDVTHPAVYLLQTNMVPMVCRDEMCSVKILTQDTGPV